MSYIIVNIEMKSKIGKKLISKGKSIVKDGVSLTTYSNSNQTKQTFEAMKKQGKNCLFQDGVIIENFEGIKAHNIADKIEKDIKVTADKFEKMVKVKCWRNYVK